MNKIEAIDSALAQARKGNIKQARKILRHIVEQDPANIKAWLGIYHLAETEPDKKAALEKVLQINPEHQKARKWLDELSAQRNRQKIKKSIQVIEKTTKKNIPSRLMIVSSIIIFLILFLAYLSGLAVYRFEVPSSTTSWNQFFTSSSFLQNILPDLFIQSNVENITISPKITPNFSGRNSPVHTDNRSKSDVVASFMPDVNIYATTAAVTYTPVLIFSDTPTPTETLTLSPSLTASEAAPPTSTPTIPSTATATETATVTNTPTQTSSPTITPSATPSAPTSAMISDIQGEAQHLSLSCESRAAATWASYFGKNIKELEFFSQLPISDNPEEGFVGDVNGEWGQIPPAPYGVHAPPVAQLLRNIGLNARAEIHIDWEILKQEIAKNRPVIVWVVGHVEPGKAVPYTAQDGQLTFVARYQHTVILIGYDDEKEEVTILDGKDRYQRPYDTFFRSWAVLGNMAVIRNSQTENEIETPPPPPNP